LCVAGWRSVHACTQDEPTLTIPVRDLWEVPTHGQQTGVDRVDSSSADRIASGLGLAGAGTDARWKHGLRTRCVPWVS
jgi:hypothetical protein